MRQGTLTIGPSHYEKSGKNFLNAIDCPATIAIKEQFGIDASLFIDVEKDRQCVIKDSDNIIIGEYTKEWGYSEFDKVSRGGTFTTTIKLYYV